MLWRKLAIAVMVGAGMLLMLARAGSVGAGVTAATVYKVDPVHSSLFFHVRHMNVGYYNGRFNELSGNIALDEQNPAQCSFEFTINAGSVDTANAKRDQHLKSPDFFNAKQFPKITFKSKSVSKSGENAYEV
ncbi:MAG TPA: YceI family protein, partial [Isosphaeraceae bacterium]|nr:YceI family protein [Isosphaeraceae bacterium]